MSRDHLLNRPGPARQRPRRVLLAALAITTATIATACSSGGSTNRSAHTTTTRVAGLVAAFQGVNNETTQSFKVKNGWELRWDTTASTFQVAIIGDKNFGTVINHKGPGGGSTYPVGGGTFRLVITAKGPWTIKVINH